MFGIMQAIETVIQKPAPEETAPEIQIGDFVTDGTRIGHLEAVVISPYYAEEIEGIERVYVWGVDPKTGFWADYWLLEEVIDWWPSVNGAPSVNDWTAC